MWLSIAKPVREFGDPVLELGCGTGRITMALAEAGKADHGLDLSERMLERAVKKRASLRVEARERLHLIQGEHGTVRSRRKIPPGHHSFRAISATSGSAASGGLSGLGFRASCAGGRLILDVFRPDAERMHDPVHMREMLVTEYRPQTARRWDHRAGSRIPSREQTE